MISTVEPSARVPVALNWRVESTGRFADGGATPIEIGLGTAATTVRVIGWVAPDIEAEMLVVPVVTPTARPEAEIVATLVRELAQVTLEVISALEPSE